MTGGFGIPEGDFGPTVRGGRRRRRWQRRLAYLLSSAALGVLIGVVAITGVLWYGTQQVGRIDIPQLSSPGSDSGGTDLVGQDIEIDELDEVLNVLVVGSDSREGLTDEQLEELGTERADGTRTDSMMLVQLDPRRDQVAVLSFPRDLLVTRCDGSRGRLNAAYGIGESTGVGGPSCLVDTIVEFTGIGVNHFVQVDFAGFIEIVDALDGVTIYLEEPLHDVHAGVDLPAGCVELDGTTALGFVRARRVDSDFGRIARQQRFIREVVTEAASVGTLVNLPRLYQLVEAGARAVDTDRDLSIGQMRRIAFSLRNLEPERLDTRTVPAVPRTIDGVAFVVAIEEEAEELFRAFREARVAPDDLGTEDLQEITIADVPPVQILNGSGVAGVAASATEFLEGRGFEVAETGNADSFDFQSTQVVYAADQLEEAELLAEALGGASLVPGDPDQPLTVVIGMDFDPAALDAEVEDTDEPGDDRAEDSPAPADSPSPAETFLGASPSNGRCP